MEKKYRFETLQLHAGQEKPDSATGARAVPIYASTSFVFDNCQQASDRFDLTDSGHIYSRISNPTCDVFEQRIAALEGGIKAVATASGSAATALALQNLLRSNDHIVSSQNIYGGTYNLLAHTFAEIGISTTFVRADDYEAYENAIDSRTRAIFIESIGNPNANLVDIEKIARIAHRHHIPLVVDNTFATPYLLRPIEFGADIVIHSATKFIGGHGTVIGGVIVDGGRFNWKTNKLFGQFNQPDPNYHGIRFTDIAGEAAYIARIRAVLLRDYGPTLSPFNAFLLLQGLETLSLRVERHVSNALAVVRFLAGHPMIEKVNHPSLPDSPSHELYKKYFGNGGASIFTIVVKGGKSGAIRFIDNLNLFSLLANVADGKSLVIHPASTTHSQMDDEELLRSGIEGGTVRISVGTEHIDDLIEDLAQALEKGGRTCR
ncbi:MAG: O-acetylhomoserine aminocarboxypropyltransferase/cysteine synthase [Spirochaetales bacterium]|nr:O-acetylhomoserine aminocarboxypropyltransferase/cysteine synthase [Spirochaetales bacterium]